MAALLFIIGAIVCQPSFLRKWSVLMNLAELRKEYTQRGLSESEADADPIAQFTCWLREAAEAGLIEPNAMTLATIDPDGRPSARMVLLKGVDERGFVFFTNYESRKGRALAAHPAVALVFYWPELERQVRVEGYAEQISAEIGCLLRYSSARKPDRCVGLAPEPAYCQPR